MLNDAGRVDEALDVALATAERGDVEAIYLASRMISEDSARAAALRRNGIEPGATMAEPWDLDFDTETGL
jgi:hypothetical protein